MAGYPVLRTQVRCGLRDIPQFGLKGLTFELVAVTNLELKFMFPCVCLCVVGTEPDSKSDLSEWLTSVGIDSDVAGKVCLAEICELCYSTK